MLTGSVKVSKAKEGAVMKIAIPSYKRAETLKNKTLKVLSGYGIKKDEIYIFVANEEERKIYESINSGYRFIIGEVGIKNIRNFMVRYFDEKEKIVYIDDDIEEIQECFFDKELLKNKTVKNKQDYLKKGRYLKRLESLKKFLDEAFFLTEKLNLAMWGIYPAPDAFFMKVREEKGWITDKLRYIIGCFYGVINDREIDIATVDDKEDFERSIHFYQKYGGVLRFNNITVQTKYYTEPGGMQIERTKERVLKSAAYLANKYPSLCKLNLSKKSGFAEVRFK